MNGKVNQARVLQFYIGGLVVFVILAILCSLLMNQNGFQIVTNFWSNNDLASQTNTIFAPASRVLFTFELRWSLVLLLAISLVSPIYYLYKLNNKVKNIDFYKFRTLDWTVTTAFMVVLISVLSGVQDFMTLILIAALTAMGYLLINVALSNKAIAKKAYISGLISIGLPWLLIIVYAIGTWVYGFVRTPWYVYVTYIIGLAVVGLVVYAYKFKDVKPSKIDATKKEIYPIIAAQLIKISFVVVLLIGLKR